MSTVTSTNRPRIIRFVLRKRPKNGIVNLESVVEPTELGPPSQQDRLSTISTYGNYTALSNYTMWSSLSPIQFFRLRFARVLTIFYLHLPFEHFREQQREQLALPFFKQMTNFFFLQSHLSFFSAMQQSLFLTQFSFFAAHFLQTRFVFFLPKHPFVPEQQCILDLHGCLLSAQQEWQSESGIALRKMGSF